VKLELIKFATFKKLTLIKPTMNLEKITNRNSILHCPALSTSSAVNDSPEITED
jgi:hypothetical protein